jgi:hypothetical protein
MFVFKVFIFLLKFLVLVFDLGTLFFKLIALLSNTLVEFAGFDHHVVAFCLTLSELLLMLRENSIEEFGVHEIRSARKTVSSRLSALLTMCYSGVDAGALAMRAALSRSGSLLGASHKSNNLGAVSKYFLNHL